MRKGKSFIWCTMSLAHFVAASLERKEGHVESFRQTLESHLESILHRDLDAFRATLADDPNLTVLLPNGGRIHGYENVIEFHRAWFADPDWRMNVSLLHTVETEAMALALL